MTFPPVPVYPKDYDTDYTLFVVYNTTETRLCSDNDPWSQEIEIIPVEMGQNDIWAVNGFANIDGELLYYDSVQTNVHGKVNKLKNCARNLGGSTTKFNKRGTWIRSFVVAEHHNQMVEAILKTQDFIGFNFDLRQFTLDWRIRNLEALEVIFDDFNCPNIDFTFNVVSTNPTTGTVATYLVEITGTINTYRLDFGDGSFTTTDFQGTHTYAVNAIIDPVVTATTDQCQIIQTPIERANPQEPPPQITEVFDIPIPECVSVPEFIFVPCTVPEPDIHIPPLVVPCISIEGQVGPIPSVITGPSYFSQIIVTGIPSNGLPSTIIIEGSVPGIIIIEHDVPPTIVIEPPIPPTIVVIVPNSSIALALDAATMPKLEVDWGTAPAMEVAMTLSKRVTPPAKFSADPDIVAKFGTEYADLFGASNNLKVEYEPVDLPSEIMIIAPDHLPQFGFDTSQLKDIKIDSSEVHIPDIKIHGPDTPIPTTINLDGSTIPQEIDLVWRGDAIPVKVETEVTIKFEEIKPIKIEIEMPKPIPERIIVESNLPSTIVLEVPEPITIAPPDWKLEIDVPKSFPPIDVVFRAEPIEVKITMDEIIDQNSSGKQCVMIVPCVK